MEYDQSYSLLENGCKRLDAPVRPAVTISLGHNLSPITAGKLSRKGTYSVLVLNYSVQFTLLTAWQADACQALTEPDKGRVMVIYSWKHSALAGSPLPQCATCRHQIHLWKQRKR